MFVIAARIVRLAEPFVVILGSTLHGEFVRRMQDPADAPRLSCLAYGPCTSRASKPMRHQRRDGSQRAIALHDMDGANGHVRSPTLH